MNESATAADLYPQGLTHFSGLALYKREETDRTRHLKKEGGWWWGGRKENKTTTMEQPARDRLSPAQLKAATEVRNALRFHPVVQLKAQTSSDGGGLR